MYHCHEIRFQAFQSFTDLQAAVESYPFKAGKIRQLPAEHELNWRQAKNPIELHLTTDQEICLADATFQTFLFTDRAKIEIDSFPNGRVNVITLYRG